MKTTIKTVDLVNPWTGACGPVDVAEILRNDLNAYPWPDEVREALDGLYDTEAEWLLAAVAMLGERIDLAVKNCEMNGGKPVVTGYSFFANVQCN